MTKTPPSSFFRSRLTWLAYAMLAYLAMNQSMLGPLMPFLRSDLDLNYTLGGLLPAALAVGLIFSGLTSDWYARRWGRRVVFWGGAALLAFGAALLAMSTSFEFVLVASLTLGFGSSLAQVMVQALLSDEHGERRAIAFAESNVAASFSATLTPLLVGVIQSIGLGWRSVPFIPLVFLAILVAYFRREPIPNRVVTNQPVTLRREHLPLLFWLYWLVLFLVVALEMSIALWATDYLANVSGLGQVNAALAFSCFPAAMLIGRWTGSRLTRRFSADKLLLVALVLSLLGFPVFWLSRSASLSVIGLFLTGLGIANLFPLTLSIAVGVAPELSNQASARVSLGVGTALLSAPLFLGWLADRFGLQNAYGVCLGFVLVAILIVISIRQLAVRQPIHQS